VAVSEGEQHGKRGQTLHAWCPPGGRSINAGVGRVRCKIVRHTLGRSGRKGAFEFLSLTRKRNQTNQLQTKLLTSGPGVGSSHPVCPTISEPLIQDADLARHAPVARSLRGWHRVCRFIRFRGASKLTSEGSLILKWPRCKVTAAVSQEG